MWINGVAKDVVAGPVCHNNAISVNQYSTQYTSDNKAARSPVGSGFLSQKLQEAETIGRLPLVDGSGTVEISSISRLGYSILRAFSYKRVNSLVQHPQGASHVVIIANSIYISRLPLAPENFWISTQ